MDAAGYAAAFSANAGEADRAFAHLERAVSLGLDTTRFYENELLFGPLSGDPRWGPFIEGVRRRVEAFRREFKWPIPGT